MSSATGRDFPLMDLVDRVYSAAVDGSWDDIALQIAAAFKSTSTTLQLQGRDHESLILSATDNVRSRLAEYQAYFWQRDIWVERAIERLGLSRIGASKDLVTDTEFAESEFYRDWCRFLDVFYVVGSVF